MSKPINIEAQRVSKILSETFEKLKVLSWLNERFFDTISNDVTGLEKFFGSELTNMLLTHAEIEEKYKTYNLDEDGNLLELKYLQQLQQQEEQKENEENFNGSAQKSMNLNDRLSDKSGERDHPSQHNEEEGNEEENQEQNIFMAEEAAKYTELLRKSTRNLCRYFFNKPGELLKVKQFGDFRTSEGISYNESFDDLVKVYQKKLTIHIEEETSMQLAVKELASKIEELTATRDSKNEELMKYLDEKNKSKESRDKEIATLKKQIADEVAKKENVLKAMNDENTNKENMFKERHDAIKKKRTDEIGALEKDIDALLKANTNDEVKLRNEHKRAELNLQERIKDYDAEMDERTKNLDDLNTKYSAEKKELNDIEELLRQIIAEKDRIIEEERKLKEKQQKRDTELKLLHQAAEWIQAHWRGMVTRKDFEKMRKGRKKKKKAKKA